jgi:hypothetical protein
LRKSPRHAVTKLAVAVTEQKVEPNPVDQNPLYGVAMLRIALELKKSAEASVGTLDAIVSKVAARMGLIEPDFRAFLVSNRGLLQVLQARRVSKA